MERSTLFRLTANTIKNISIILSSGKNVVRIAKITAKLNKLIYIILLRFEDS